MSSSITRHLKPEVRKPMMNKFLYDSVEKALLILNSISNSLAVIASVLKEYKEKRVD